MENRLVRVLIMLACCCVGAGLYAYCNVHRDTVPRVCRLIAKAMPGCCCAAAALSCALGRGTPAMFLLAAGLALCAAADAVLEISFIPGMGVFALAHCSFIAYMCVMGVNIPTAAAVAGAWAIAISLVWVFFGAKWHIPAYFVIYACAVCGMSAVAAGRGVFALLGGLCFVASDGMLGLRILTGAAKGQAWYGPVLMLLYYGALFLLMLDGVLV